MDEQKASKLAKRGTNISPSKSTSGTSDEAETNALKKSKRQAPYF